MAPPHDFRASRGKERPSYDASSCGPDTGILPLTPTLTFRPECGDTGFVDLAGQGLATSPRIPYTGMLVKPAPGVRLGVRKAAFFIAKTEKLIDVSP